MCVILKNFYDDIRHSSKFLVQFLVAKLSLWKLHANSWGLFSFSLIRCFLLFRVRRSSWTMAGRWCHLTTRWCGQRWTPFPWWEMEWDWNRSTEQQLVWHLKKNCNARTVSMYASGKKVVESRPYTAQHHPRWRTPQITSTVLPAWHLGSDAHGSD